MKRLLVLALSLCLLLGGCRAPFSLPRAQEPSRTAIASVLGIKEDEGQVKIFAASQGRGSGLPLRYEGEGRSISGALQKTRDQGLQTVSYAHVEHLLLEAEAVEGRLSQLLSYSFQSGEQSIESHLWLLRDVEMEDIFTDELDLAKRLNTLKNSGAAGTSLPQLSLRMAAARLADSGAALLPALRLREGELVFDSYALIRDGILVGYLEGEEARMAQVLAGEALYWTEQVRLEGGGEATVQMHSGSGSVRPVIEGGELLALEITCSVDGTLTEFWSAQGVQNLHAQVEAKVQRQMEGTLARLQELNADGTQLRRQAGLGAIWDWDILEKQWKARFAELPIQVTVTAKLAERF